MGGVVGLDIGGSKTHAIWTPDGGKGGRGHSTGEETSREAFAPSANALSVGEDAAGDAVREVAEGLGSPRPDVVVAGAAGADSSDAAERLRALIAPHFPGALIRVVHDTRIILAAAGLKSGTVLISGTGSVAWGRADDGRELRAGGLGYLLGDEGGGYAITRDAVRKVLERTLDAGEDAESTASTEPEAAQSPRESPLARRLCAAAGVPRPWDLLAAFYREPERRFWASLAGQVVHAADEGDLDARDVLSLAAAELAALASRVRAGLWRGEDQGDPGPVVLAGGLLVHESVLASLARGHLSSAGVTDCRVLLDPPARGALQLAQDLSRGHRLI